MFYPGNSKNNKLTNQWLQFIFSRFLNGTKIKKSNRQCNKFLIAVKKRFHTAPFRNENRDKIELKAHRRHNILAGHL